MGRRTVRLFLRFGFRASCRCDRLHTSFCVDIVFISPGQTPRTPRSGVAGIDQWALVLRRDWKAVAGGEVRPARFSLAPPFAGRDPGQPQTCLCSSVTQGCGDDSHLAGGSVVITWYTGVLAEHQFFSLGWERAGGQDKKEIRSPRTPPAPPTPPHKSHLILLSLP